MSDRSPVVVQDYERTNITDWTVDVMSTRFVARAELLRLAKERFPEASHERLVGHVGQMWSDCMKPRYARFASGRGLRAEQRVIEGVRERRLVPARQR
jgi:hypothetical protein